MSPFTPPREYCIEVFLPSRSSVSAAETQRVLTPRLASLNDTERPWASGCRTSATLGSGVVVLEVTAHTDDEKLWAGLKRRLSEEATTIGEVVRSFAADPDEGDERGH